ncbi:MAG: Ig-like domain repeat protein [Candidatus Sulfotelmatobacter sp.]
MKTQAQWRIAVRLGLQHWGGQRELRCLGYAGLVWFLLASGLTRHAAAQSCTNYACFQVSCLGGATTSISGTTYAPNGVDPIPNVLVYVPNGTVQPFVDGPADDTEASLVTGDPLVLTTSAANGTFTLANVPAGTSFPLVLQAGRWRRQLTVPSLTSCVNTPVLNFNPPSDVFSRFPKTQVEGDIPKMALATGGVDALECSLRKIGIADTEFTDYTVNASGLSSPGRINLFEGAGNSGAKAGSTVHTESQLVGSTSSTIGGSLLGNYNVLLLPCQGTFGYTTADGRGNAITFAGEGGRIFATHHSDTYLDQDAAIDGAADWLGDANSVSLGSGEATINTGFSSGMTLAQWLQDIGSTSTVGQVAMTALFNDQSGVNAPTQSWATLNGGDSQILQLSFYTPVGSPAASQFGRVMYNEYHVDSTSTNDTVTFPSECTGGLAKTSSFTPQEHMLEYSLFDLMNFSVPVAAPTVSIGITHSPTTFTGGDTGDTVTVTVENTGASAIATAPPVSLTVTLPAGLTPVAMTDALGLWTCVASTLTCTLTSSWSAGVSDPVTITVSVAANIGAGSPSISATVASAGFSSNVASPITINIAAAPAGTVTSGTAVSAGTVELQSTATATTDFALSGGTTVGTIAVVTQGATGLDFTNAGSGTCAITTYGSGATCTVSVTFSPTHPGPRLGAVKLLDGSGSLLATQFVTAIGVSPQVIFSPGVQSALGGGFNQPYGVATDSSGNVYLADQAHNAVKEIPSGCVSSSCVLTVGGGFSLPYGVAVDGAGNVLVADNANNAVKKIPPGCTSSTCVSTVAPVGGPAGLTVDGDGNIFVTDAGDGIVLEIPQGCLATGCTITLGGGWSNPTGVATDGNGNLFVADEGDAAVKELAITCLTAGCVSVVGAGLSQPYSLAVDASGNIFVGDQGSTAVKKITSGCTSASCVSTLSGVFVHPFGIALDGSGNLFVGDASATTAAKLDFGDPPALAYASLHVGSTSSAQAVTVGNDGNATLDFTSSGLTAPTDFIQAAGSGTPTDCASSGTVTAGAGCNLSIEFSPLSVGGFSESFVLTDNDLNVSTATQSISLSGTGLAADSTAVAVGVNPSSPGVGQAVNITATVSDTTSASIVPTGSVTFSDSVDGSLNGGAAVTLVSGVASLTGVVLSGGGGTAHTITANYQGVAHFFLASSNSATVYLASAAATSTTLAAAPNPAPAGATVTLTASISPVPTGPSLGTVSFYDGETLLGTANANSSGAASFPITTLSAGAHSLTAVYSGNPAFAGSTSSVLIETITTLTGTTTTLVAAPSPASVGESVTLTATVTPAPTGSPLGTVSFYNGATLLGSGTLNSSGVAAFSTTSLPAGSDSLTVIYSGNTAFASSTSSVLTETITTLTGTTTTLVAAPSPASAGESVTLTATVSPAPTGSSPGTVSFYNGATLLGSGTLNSLGVATFSTTSLPAGSDSLTAVYSGNLLFAASTSAALSETVNTSYTVTAPPAPLSVAQGGSVQVNVTVPPVGGAFNNPVTMSATGLPSGATASFNPLTVTPGTAGAHTVMTIQLAPLAAAVVPEVDPPYRPWPLPSFALALALCGFGLRRKRVPVTLRRTLLLAPLALSLLAMFGCGGGWRGPSTTPPGSFVVTITGTSGTLTASTAVTVVVQ